MSTAVLDVEAVKEGLKGVLSWPYQTNKVVMLQYQKTNTAIFPEEFLASLYYRLKEEGSLHKIFPGMALGHLNDYMAYMAKVSGLVICCLKTPEKPRPVGLGWICESSGGDGARRATFGFGFFKEVWGWQQNVDLSWMMLHYWFDVLKVDVLYGTTLKSNRLAVRYSKYFGFDFLCTLPMFFTVGNALVDADLIVLKKTEFIPRYNVWRKGVE